MVDLKECSQWVGATWNLRRNKPHGIHECVIEGLYTWQAQTLPRHREIPSVLHCASSSEAWSTRAKIAVSHESSEEMRRFSGTGVELQKWTTNVIDD